MPSSRWVTVIATSSPKASRSVTGSALIGSVSAAFRCG
jgi:hypothetical protein